MRKQYHPSDLTRLDRYLAINAWLKKRYSEDGWLTLFVGGVPTICLFSTGCANASGRWKPRTTSAHSAPAPSSGCSR